MVKLIFVAYRRADLTHEEFCRYWYEVHAPLVCGMQETIGLRRYVQNHPLPPEVNGPYAGARGMGLDDLPDGIVEAWWDSPEAMDACFASEAGQAAARLMLADEAEFVDYGRSRALLTEQRTIIEGEPGGPWL